MKKHTLTLEEMFCKTRGHDYVTKRVIDLTDDDVRNANHSRGLKILHEMYMNMSSEALYSSFETVIDYCNRCKNWKDSENKQAQRSHVSL